MTIWVSNEDEKSTGLKIIEQIQQEKTTIWVDEGSPDIVAICSHCGYDLRGHSGEGICPECGQDFRTWDKDIECPHCRERVPPHFEVCWSCGENISAN